MRDIDPHGLYHALGISPSATAEEIKSAYRQLAKQTHPDTAGKGSTDRFHRISAAYEILGDPARRAEYDSSSYTAEPQDPHTQPVDPICCSRCGQVTAQPRYIVFFRVYSYIFGTIRTPIQGIFCANCAKKESIRSSIFTMLAGWWAFPWGPVYTFKAIISNGFGGKHEKKSAEAFIWFNALAFLSRRNLKLSYALALLAKHAQDQAIAADAAELVAKLEGAGVDPRQGRLKNPWKIPPAIAVAHMLMAISLPGIIAALLWLDSNKNTAPYRPRDVTTQPTFSQPIAVEPVAPTCAYQPRNGQLLGSEFLRSESGHALEIKNGGGSNAIIKVRRFPTNAAIAMFFVSKGQTARMEGIPDGTYKIQYSFGEKLNEGCNGFVKVLGAGQFPKEETLKTRRTINQITTQILSYTLYTVPSGNVRPQTISASEFNRP